MRDINGLEITDQDCSIVSRPPIDPISVCEKRIQALEVLLEEATGAAHYFGMNMVVSERELSAWVALLHRLRSQEAVDSAATTMKPEVKILNKLRPITE